MHPNFDDSMGFKNIGIFFFLFMFCFSLQGQDKVPSTELLSPRDAVYNHLYYLQGETYQPQKAKTSLFPEKGIDLEQNSILLKQILDGKGLYVALSKIPKEADYLNEDKKNIYVLFPNELPEVFVQKYEGEWLYSEETVEMIPILHKKMYPYGSGYLLKILPAIGTGKFLGVKTWQYLGIAIYLLIGFIIFFILTRISDIVIGGISNSKLGRAFPDENLIHSISKLIAYVIIISLFILFLPVLQLPINFSRFLFIALDILRYSFAIILALRVLDFIMIFVGKAVSETETKMDDQLQVIIKRAIQIGIVIFGLIAILSRLDINVTALLAGASIGGLAIALAAQDTVKNLLGAVMIFVDKPFDIGDYVITGSATGVIHEVGFRSTKLMASDTSIISVPNGKLADEVINNLGKRVYRRYRTNIGVTYSTSPELINKFTEGIREIFNAHDKLLTEKTAIHLSEFSASSLDILVQGFIDVNSWSEEMEIKHGLMIDIIKLADELGVNFAFPSQELYIKELPKNN